MTVRYVGLRRSWGTSRQPAAEAAACVAALRVPTNARSAAPAVSSGATPESSFSPSPSKVEPSQSASSRTRISVQPLHGAAIHGDGNARDIAGALRCQKDYQVGELLRLPDASQRIPARPPAFDLRGRDALFGGQHIGKLHQPRPGWETGADIIHQNVRRTRSE